MPEPEAELQATANLSPVSPSPVHAASPLVVPALQETVDTIDAMVAAVVASSSRSGDDHLSLSDPAGHLNNGDTVDDDPYSDDGPAETAALPEQTEVPNSNDDDYAKTFDSPIGSDELGGQDEPSQAHSHSAPRPSGSVGNFPSVASHSVIDPSLTQGSDADHAAGQSQVNRGSVISFSQQHHNTASAEQNIATPAHVPGDPHSDASQSEPSIDLQRLVADLTAQSTEPPPNSTPDPNAAKATQDAGSSSISSGLPSSASLPPRPPQPNSASQAFVSQHHPGATGLNHVPNPSTPSASGQPMQLVAAGAPGTSTGAISNLPPPPGSALSASATTGSHNTANYAPHAPGYHTDRKEDDYRSKWEQFLSDERQYMSEAKWDRFPEGSRIFIGNLSSDKVSKRDVFDVFHNFGRLAQISLKSAYGFVQYHTVDEGHRAIEAMEGAEIKGRRIHLEVSKLQDKSRKDRGRSPDKARGSRDGGRDGGRDGVRRNERNDRFAASSRDDHRGRNHSPRRNDYNDGHGRDRGYHDNGHGRGRRSRSPGPSHGRSSRDYRRRSPSPYGRSRNDGELDLPRRYGAEVPDLQIILQPDVNREFTAWVESIFKAKGLRTEVMFLHPRMPKDQVIQRQAVEGVHGVVDLDLRAQHMGKIPLQAFDRSAGASNIRFDQYVDLDPSIAAEVILRTKATSVPSYGSQQYASMPTGTYGNPYGGQGQPPAANSYNGMPAYPPQQQAPSHQAADIASLIGKVDQRTLQQILASYQGGAQPAMPHAVPTHATSAPMPQHDIQALLNSIGQQPTQAPQQAPVSGQYGAPYGAQAAPYQQPPAHGDSAAQVQNIMAQLARYRQ